MNHPPCFGRNRPSAPNEAIRPMMEFTLIRSARIPSGACSARDLHDLAAYVLAAERAAGPVELTLDLTHPARIHQLNRRFRGVDRPTDVISFRGDRSDASGFTGDVAINVQQAARQAGEIGHPLRREIRLLWIHGILHLMGYTDYSPSPRRRMFSRQNHLLRHWEQRHP